MQSAITLIFAILLSTNVYAEQVIPEPDRNFDIDEASPEARGKSQPVAGKSSKYTDAAGFYTFVMPSGWKMEVFKDEASGMAFKGSSGKHQVNCIVYGKDYRRGPKTLAELQALPESTARATFEPALIADTGWKGVEKRGSLALGGGGKGKLKPVNAWTWASPAPDGKAWDTVAIVEAPATMLLVLCGSSKEGQAATEEVIRRSFRLAEGALIAPAIKASATPGAKPQDKAEGGKIFQEAMRAWQRGDYDTARQMLLPLAEQGDALALNNLGVMHEKGYGVARDDAEAAKWYRKAADLGNAKAQFSLGVMHANGRGVDKDEAQASAWYLKAAQQGHAEAQYNMGLRYANGRGVEKGAAEAANWYRKSAEQGYAKAQVNLGLQYSKGEGVGKDDAEAVKWYRQSAEQGNVNAQNNLGLKLLNGHGTARDPQAAAMWLSLAAEGGDKNASARLSKLEQEFGPEQMAQTKKLADECKSRDYKNCP